MRTRTATLDFSILFTPTRVQLATDNETALAGISREQLGKFLPLQTCAQGQNQILGNQSKSTQAPIQLLQSVREGRGLTLTRLRCFRGLANRYLP
jgi:hypothetical protein